MRTFDLQPVKVIYIFNNIFIVSLTDKERTLRILNHMGIGYLLLSDVNFSVNNRSI